MSLNLTTLFDRLGKVAGQLQALNDWRGGQADTGVADVGAEYAAAPDLVRDLAAATLTHRRAGDAYAQYLAALEQRTLVEAVKADSDAVGVTGLAASVEYLVKQMASQSASVAANAVAVTVSAVAGNTGTAAVRASVKGVDGATLQNCYAETVTVACTVDAQGGGTAGREKLVARGFRAAANALDPDWPAGSGCNAPLTAVAPGFDLLANGGMEAFTVTDQPDKWATAAGTVTTDYGADSAVYMQGARSLKLKAAGNIVRLTQAFGDSTVGTGNYLKPLTQYAVNCWVRATATAPTAGVIALELVDGSGTVVNDAASVANQITVNASTLTTAWVSLGGFFRTPAALPSTLKLQLRATAALDQPVNVDAVCLVVPTALYAGGPAVAVFAGATALIKNDAWTLAVTNDRAGAWQTHFARAFGTMQLGVKLPTSGSPTLGGDLISPPAVPGGG